VNFLRSYLIWPEEQAYLSFKNKTYPGMASALLFSPWISFGKEGKVLRMDVQCDVDKYGKN
jgi:hypothetical protein